MENEAPSLYLSSYLDGWFICIP